VAILAAHFATGDGRTLASGVVEVLASYSWPGNVRELRAVIARAGCLVNYDILSPEAVAEAIGMGAGAAGEAPRSRSGVRTQLPQTTAGWIALGRANGWRAARMAAAAGVGRTTLFAELGDQGRSLATLPEFTRSRESSNSPRTLELYQDSDGRKRLHRNSL
jgi:transcriptional regulator of acetoin/glycerol metabolism